MKAFTQIQLQLIHLKAEVKALEHKHGELHQIDMLSSEGNRLRERIQRMEGKVDALNWVIHDQIIGDL
jgi:hypothetical protein